MCTIKTKEGRLGDNNGKRNYGKGNGARATKVGPFPCRSAWCRSPSSGRSPPCIGNTRVSLAGIWLGIFDHVSLIFKHSLRAWKMRSGKTDRIWPSSLMQGQILCSMQLQIWNGFIQPHTGFRTIDEKRDCHMRRTLWSCSKLSFLFSITLLKLHWQLFPVQQFPFTHFFPCFWFWAILLSLIKLTTSDIYRLAWQLAFLE